MKKVILIKFHMDYEPNADVEAVALTQELADKYVEELKIKFPNLYPHGKFYFEPIYLVEE